MTLLTKRVGPFPLGIWIVLVQLFFSGIVFGVLGQALSLFDWEVAISLGFQEDSRNSTDVLERTMGAISWGEAGADVLVHGPLIILTLIGILRRRHFGFVAGVATGTLWIYAALMLTLQRIGLYSWGLTPDLSRVKSVGLPMILLCGIPGVISLVCLTANQNYFGNGKVDQGKRQ